jgi:DNA polymerase-3 subunit alpha
VVQGDDGQLDGAIGTYYAQAMRIEGVKKSQGKHAAGVLISPDPLAELYPMVFDKTTNQPIVGYEMADVEAAGGVKFDLLGVAALDKVMGAMNTVRTLKVGLAAA